MEQAPLFFESYLDALRDDVRAIGGAKVVGMTLRPDLGAENARNWCNDRLNEHRRDRFTDSEQRWIYSRSREKRGFSAALAYVCDESGFERPKALNPYDEAAELQRQFIQAAELVQSIGERLERVSGMTLPVKGVK